MHSGRVWNWDSNQSDCFTHWCNNNVSSAYCCCDVVYCKWVNRYLFIFYVFRMYTRGRNSSSKITIIYSKCIRARAQKMRNKLTKTRKNYGNFFCRLPYHFWTSYIQIYFRLKTMNILKAYTEPTHSIVYPTEIWFLLHFCAGMSE